MLYLQIIPNLKIRVIQLHDKHFVPFISAAEIDRAVARLAEEVSNDMGEEVPVFIGVLNGAFMVASDFMKHYKKSCEISFAKLSSYEGTTSTHNVKQLIGINQDLTGRTVIIIEDIVDTGATIEELKNMFEHKGVKNFRVITLFFKPEAYTRNIAINYKGFEIANNFIVGYGLDYDGLGRNLPEIYQLQ